MPGGVDFLEMHIYLLGFMGAGKTTVGRLLADQLGRPFVDLDDVVVQRAALSIPQIFERFGEAFFRQLESEALRYLAQQAGKVVATGGGVILSEQNREILKTSGFSIYLEWPTDLLMQRLLADTNRPLLAAVPEDQLLSHIETMLRQRQHFYEQADLIIHGQRHTDPDDIVTLIIKNLPSNF